MKWLEWIVTAAGFRERRRSRGEWGGLERVLFVSPVSRIAGTCIEKITFRGKRGVNFEARYVHTYVETYGGTEWRKRKRSPGRKVALRAVFPGRPWHCWFYGVIIHILIRCHDRFLANPTTDCQILIQPYLQDAASRSSIKMPEVLHCQAGVYVYVWLWYNTENNIVAEGSCVILSTKYFSIIY